MHYVWYLADAKEFQGNAIHYFGDGNVYGDGLGGGDGDGLDYFRSWGDKDGCGYVHGYSNHNGNGHGSGHGYYCVY